MIERADPETETTQAAPATTAPLTRAQLIAQIIASLDKMPVVRFDGLYALEYGIEDEVRKMSTIGTAFEPVVAAMNQAGVPTASTVGDVMGGLDLELKEVYSLICNCHDEKITGSVLADRFRRLKQ